MKPGGRLQAGLALLGVVVVFGTFGYMLIEEMPFNDALFMTVITITTVGFSVIGGPLTPAGEYFTIALILTGTGTVLYTAAVVLETTIEAFIGGQRRRRQMDAQIAALNGHVILCGFGRVGHSTWQQLRREGSDVVVIDVDPEMVALGESENALMIQGDATHDDVLQAAGIERAGVLISAVRSDSDNLVIVLSAKAQRPDLLVISRAVEMETEKKLFLAGADRVVAPQVVGAQRLAALALKPDLAEFIDLVVSGTTVEFRVEEQRVADGAEMVGKSLREVDVRRKAGALVLAIGDDEGRMWVNPDPGIVIRPGQIVIGIGTMEQLERLRTLTTSDH